VLGVPARVVRATDDPLRGRIASAVAAYLELAEQHRRGNFPQRHSTGSSLDGA